MNEPQVQYQVWVHLGGWKMTAFVTDLNRATLAERAWKESNSNATTRIVCVNVMTDEAIASAIAATK